MKFSLVTDLPKIEEIISELESRFGTSGHLEKASRSSSEEEK